MHDGRPGKLVALFVSAKILIESFESLLQRHETTDDSDFSHPNPYDLGRTKLD